MFAALLLLLADVASPPGCRYDREVLGLGIDAFDQDMKGGWRALADQPGCEAKAADLIRAYRLNQEAALPALYLHEAQLRASAGDYVGAIPLLMRARQRDFDEAGLSAYIDATIAFLRGDRAALTAAKERLRTWPKPADWPVDSPWPPNMNVVEGLEACFGKPYKLAYDVSCRPTP